MAAPGLRFKTPSRAAVPLEDGRRRRHKEQYSSHARQVRVNRLPVVVLKREQVPNRVVHISTSMEALASCWLPVDEAQLGLQRRVVGMLGVLCCVVM